MNNWREHALCRGMGPDLFFADRGHHETLKTAMEICNGHHEKITPPIGRTYTINIPPCPVKQQCLEFALQFPKDEDSHGVFGGLVPAARNKIRIARKEAGIYIQVDSIAKEMQTLRGRNPQPVKQD